MSRWSLNESTPPGAAIEIASDHVSVATVAMHGNRPAVTGHASLPLPDGAVAPSLAAQNIRDRAAVVTALTRALEAVGRPRRVALVVPDPVSKVSLLKFEQVPPRHQDLEQLVRWQVRKAAPFPIEAAQITWQPGARAADGHEFLVSMARTDVIAEYESVCAAAGAYAGLVDTTTFNVINAVLAGSSPSARDWLLFNVATDYTSIAIMRGGDLIFFRSRTVDAEGTLADLVHQTAMYYEDRLTGEGFDCVLLAGRSVASDRQSADADQIRRNLQDRLGTPVETVATRIPVDVTDRIGGSAALVSSIAPLIGILLRGREVAA